MKHNIPLIAVSIGLAACSSVNSHAVAKDVHPDNICIIRNPDVIVTDFVPAIQTRLQHYGINSRLVETADKSQCPYTLEYTVKRSWSLKTYISWAKLKLYKDGQAIADAEYKPLAKGAFMVNKWQSTETIMNPVVDSLLGKK